MLLFTTYIPPRTSKYSELDLFDEIEKELSNINWDTCEILLTGDCNSHVGNLEDCCELDRNLCNSTGIDEILRQAMDTKKILVSRKINPNRVNCDKMPVELYSERLVELCNSAGIFIMNGGCGNDLLQVRPTTKMGTVVDYCIGTASLISRIFRFEVAEFDPIVSDVHCKVSLELKGIDTMSDKQRLKSTCQVLTETDGKKLLAKLTGTRT